jgi:hypothetical protein
MVESDGVMTADEILERLAEARTVGLEGRILTIHADGCAPPLCSCRPREVIALPTREAVHDARKRVSRAS